MIKHSTLILITKKFHLFLVLKKLVYTHSMFKFLSLEKQQENE